MPAPTVAPAPLQNGDRLARDDFERRYHAMPHVKKAELIEGRVYMPSPTHADAHGRPHSILAGWLLFYEAYTDYVYAYDNATVRLDLDNEVQPDVLLRIDEDAGGQSRISDDDYVEGAPELVVEVAHSSAAYDLHDKKTAYRRNGVQEYVVWQIEENQVDWFALDGAAYTTREAEDGRIESRAFPGLVLDVGALLERDVAGVLDAVREGVGGEAHRGFVAGLEEKSQRG